MSAEQLFPHVWLTPFIHYPNVNNLTDVLSDSGRRQLLESLQQASAPRRKGIVYVHVPFCTSHCTFCFYNIRLAKEGNPAFEKYVDAVVAEIELYAASQYVQSLDIEHVFIGGGTPSVLPPELMKRLFGTIKTRLFPNKEPGEFSIEFALQTMTEDRVRTCREEGVSRISFGWQSFSPTARKMMGLVPTIETLETRIQTLREFGFAVNTDLIYGLPGQSAEDWESDLARSVHYGFDGIDTFPIQPVPPSPLYSLMRKNKLSVANGEELLARLKTTIARLSEAGFTRSNFQRFHRPDVPAARHLYNNAMFSTEHDILAFGSGSIGLIAERPYMNVRDIDGYMRWQKDVASPMSCAAQMSPERWVERALCLQLPWLGRVDKRLLRTGLSAEQRQVAQQLREHGLLEETDEELRLRPEAEGYNFNIARAFVSTENRVRNEEYAQSLAQEINWRPPAKTRHYE